jgi:hypothetical protein
MAIEQYARDRLAYLDAVTADAATAAAARVGILQDDIWRRAIATLDSAPAPLVAAFVLSLNDMFDSSTSQRYATESKVPTETSVMLLAGALLATGALGYQTGLEGRRQVVLALLLFTMLAGGMVLVVDFSRARGGFTRIDTTPLQWTIQGFSPSP